MIKLKAKQTNKKQILRDSASYVRVIVKEKIYSWSPYTFFTNLAVAPNERRNVSDEIVMCYNSTLWRTYNINK